MLLIKISLNVNSYPLKIGPWYEAMFVMVAAGESHFLWDLLGETQDSTTSFESSAHKNIGKSLLPSTAGVWADSSAQVSQDLEDPPENVYYTHTYTHT